MYLFDLLLLVGFPPTCGLTGNLEIFCTNNGVTHTGPLPFNPPKGKRQPIVAEPGTAGLNAFMDSDPLNPCNCAAFFAANPGSDPLPPNCAMAPHPKTIMLNADMVQNFPITSQYRNGCRRGTVRTFCS